MAPPRKNKRSSKRKQDPLQREQSTEEPSSVDDEVESAKLKVEAEPLVPADAAVSDDAKSTDVEEPRVEPAGQEPAVIEKVTQEFAHSEKSTPVPSRRKSKTTAPSIEAVKAGSDSVKKGPSKVQADQKAAQVTEKTEGAGTKLVPTRRKSKTVGPTTGLQVPAAVDGKKEADVPNDSNKTLPSTSSESKSLELRPEQPTSEVEDGVGVTEGQMPSSSPGVLTETGPATLPESVPQVVGPADERPEETTEDQSETATAEESKIQAPRRKSKAAETPLKEKEKAKLSPALRKTKTPTKSPALGTKVTKDVSRNPERQKFVEETEAAVSKETKLIPTKRKAKNGNGGGTAELERKNSQEPEGGAATVGEQEGTPTETSVIKESPPLATARKSKSGKASPDLSSKKDKEAVKKPGKPSKPNETATVEEPKASPSNRKSKPSPETRKSSEKPKTTDGEKGVIAPPKRKLSVKPSSEAPTSEPAKSKDSPGSRKADPAKGKGKTTVETSAAEKGKVSPAVRKSKGVKTVPATKSNQDDSKDQDLSLTPEVVSTAKEGAETAKMSVANSELENLEVSLEDPATDQMKTETEPEEQEAASTSEVPCAPEVTNTTGVTDIQASSSAAQVIKSSEEIDGPAKVQQTEDAVIKESEVRPSVGEQSLDDITTDAQETEGLKSVEPVATDQMHAEKEQDAPRPPSAPQTTDVMTVGSSTEVPAEEHELSQDQKQSTADLLPDVPVEEEAKPDSTSEGQKPSGHLLSDEPENTTEVLHGQDQSSIPEVITVATDMNVEENKAPPVDLTSKDQSPEVTLENSSVTEEELPKTVEIPDEETAKPTPRQSDGLETSAEPPATQLVKAKEEEVCGTSQQVVTSEVAEENRTTLLPTETLETEHAVEKVTPTSPREEQRSDEVSLAEANAGETGTIGVPTKPEPVQSGITEHEDTAEDIPEHGATQSVGALAQPQSGPPTEPSGSPSLAEYIEKVCDGADQLPKRYLVLDVPEVGFVQTDEMKSAPPGEKTVAQVDSSHIFWSTTDRGSELVGTGSEREVDLSEKPERLHNVSESHDLEKAEPEIRILQLDVKISSEEPKNGAEAKNVDLIQTSVATESAPVDKDTSTAEVKSEKDQGKDTGVEESSRENQDGANIQLAADSKELEEEKMKMVGISSPEQLLVESTPSESEPGESGSAQGETQKENPAVIITVTQGEEPDREGVAEPGRPGEHTGEKTIIIVHNTITGPQVPEQDLVGPAGAASQPNVEQTEFIEIDIYEQDVSKDSRPTETPEAKMPKVEEVLAKCEGDVPESDSAQLEAPQTVEEKVVLPNGDQLLTLSQLQELKEQDVISSAPEVSHAKKAISETEPVVESNIRSQVSVSSVEAQGMETKSTERQEEQQESARPKEQSKTVVRLETRVDAAGTTAPGEEISPRMKSPKVRLLPPLHPSVWLLLQTASTARWK